MTNVSITIIHNEIQLKYRSTNFRGFKPVQQSRELRINPRAEQFPFRALVIRLLNLLLEDPARIRFRTRTDDQARTETGLGDYTSRRIYCRRKLINLRE